MYFETNATEVQEVLFSKYKGYYFLVNSLVFDSGSMTVKWSFSILKYSILRDWSSLIHKNPGKQITNKGFK